MIKLVEVRIYSTDVRWTVDEHPGGDGQAGADALGDGGHGGHGVSGLATKAELRSIQG